MRKRSRVGYRLIRKSPNSLPTAWKAHECNWLWYNRDMHELSIVDALIEQVGREVHRSGQSGKVCGLN